MTVDGLWSSEKTARTAQSSGAALDGAKTQSYVSVATQSPPMVSKALIQLGILVVCLVAIVLFQVGEWVTAAQLVVTASAVKVTEVLAEYFQETLG
jgi:hypothetical protein